METGDLTPEQEQVSARRVPVDTPTFSAGFVIPTTL